MADTTADAQYSESLERYNAEHAIAEEMVPLLGALYRARTTVCTVYGNGLNNTTVIGILKAHKAVRHAEPGMVNGLPVEQSAALLRALAAMGEEVGPVKIDLGKLAVAYAADGGDFGDADAVRAFMDAQVKAVVGGGPLLDEDRGRDVVLYGFGRIGRLVARVLLEKMGAGNQLALRAVVVRSHMDEVADLHKRASLLRRDSTHGKFNGMIAVDEDEGCLVVNGVRIKVIYASDRGAIDYTAYGIRDALIIDNTGIWRKAAELAVHLNSPGASKVILTAPGKSGVPNVVVGVNSDGLDLSGGVWATASCTTNAVCPPLVVLDAAFGVDAVHIETIHSYTNDQNLLDNFHKKERRGRAAPLNLVLTETGAADAVADALPELAGKITGSAIRCPTPEVSLAILILTLRTETTVEEVNETLRLASISGPLQRQLGFSNSREAASTDMVDSRPTAIIDGPSTIVHGNRVNVYVWYANEHGFCHQVVRLTQILAGIKHIVIPDDS